MCRYHSGQSIYHNSIFIIYFKKKIPSALRAFEHLFNDIIAKEESVLNPQHYYWRHYDTSV